MQTISGIKHAVCLPLTVDPLLSAQRQACYVGSYPRTALVRLSAATVAVVSDIQVKVNFSIDAQQLIVISGSTTVEVSLACQRCGDCFIQVLAVDYCVSPVASDEAAKKLPTLYDPILLIQPERLDLVTFIEDELLLGLPLVPSHLPEECRPDILGFLDTHETVATSDDSENRPFASLACLKKKC